MKSLSRKIFTTVLAFTLAAVAALWMALVFVYYWAYERDPAHSLAETSESFFEAFAELLLPFAVVLVVTVVLVLAFSRMLTARIMKPINALDFSEPLENEIYDEMTPLLERIADQQNQLKAQNRELARAESVRRDFSANVSHEMKTPLQVISGYAELMKGGMVDEADTRKFAGLIYDEAQTMRQLINDVLTLSRLDEPTLSRERVAVDVLGVARRVAGRLEGFARDRDVLVRVGGCSAVVMGSETLIEEMLYNLVENGIRYNREGGQVTVGVTLVVVPDAAPGAAAEAVVCVRDTGMGIPLAEQEKVFERFYRMEKSRSKETGGTGLGLAIVKHVVLQHDGTIEVESTVGEGTAFILRFPAGEIG